MSAPTIAGLLADEERRRVFAAVALGATTADEIADRAGLERDVVRAVLPRLVSSGVIRQADGLRVGTDVLREGARQRPPRNRELPGATPDQARVLRNFAADGRLIALPVKASQRRVVLEYVAGRFERGREYAERDVNDLLSALHADYATLRRALVDERLLEREHGVYKRL